MSDIELIDSHCHLIFENFEKDLEDVVLRLRSKGVKKLVHACCELTEIPKLKKISHEYNEIYYSVGLHPLEAKKWEEGSKSLLRKAAQEDRRVVAIGELGLDFFKNQNKTQQIEALIPQMELAYELKLPVIIHCRDAANEMKQFFDLCFYISFSGIVTFPKAY